MPHSPELQEAAAHEALRQKVGEIIDTVDDEEREVLIGRVVKQFGLTADSFNNPSIRSLVEQEGGSRWVNILRGNLLRRAEERAASEVVLDSRLVPTGKETGRWIWVEGVGYTLQGYEQRPITKAEVSSVIEKLQHVMVRHHVRPEEKASLLREALQSTDLFTLRLLADRSSPVHHEATGRLDTQTFKAITEFLAKEKTMPK